MSSQREFYHTQFTIDCLSTEPLIARLSLPDLHSLVSLHGKIVGSVETTVSEEIDAEQVLERINETPDLETLGLDEDGDDLDESEQDEDASRHAAIFELIEEGVIPPL